MNRRCWYSLLVMCLMQSGTAQQTASSQVPLDLGVTFSTTVTEAVFGSTVVEVSGLKGNIYRIKPQTVILPDFGTLKPIGTIYTKGLNVSPRLFTQGFPGVTDLVEWFAIDYTGKFYSSKQGEYDWVLISDDGSKLYIDDDTVVNNDGVHSTRPMRGSIKLSVGVHTIRVSYFQGSRYALALLLAVRLPGQQDYRVFNTDEFQQPQNTAVEKSVSPPSPDPSSPAGFETTSSSLGKLSGFWKSDSGAILSIQDRGGKIEILNLSRPELKYDARWDGESVMAVVSSPQGHVQGIVIRAKDAVHLQAALFPYNAKDSKDASLKKADKALGAAPLTCVRVWPAGNR